MYKRWKLYVNEESTVHIEECIPVQQLEGQDVTENRQLGKKQQLEIQEHAQSRQCSQSLLSSVGYGLLCSVCELKKNLAALILLRSG